jgi:glycosyltransferase involved in cell wall biosynthesis
VTSTVGGAGIAAKRLNRALNEIGVESLLITGDKVIAKDEQFQMTITKSMKTILKSKFVTLGQRELVQSGEDLITTFSTRALKIESVLETNPDIIHIHSFYNLLNDSEIRKIIGTKIPIIFTLHDERVLTGGCHCTDGCSNFRSACIKCPQTRGIFHNRVSTEKVYWNEILNQNQSITLVCPSDWMASQVTSSGLAHLERLTIIRNPASMKYIETELAEPINASRKKFVITFISHNIHNPYKGIENLLTCISMYSKELQTENIVFRFVGNGLKPDIPLALREFLPSLSEMEMIEMYDTSNLLIVPSRSDNSPNVIFEATLRGKPFLASNRTGLPELSALFGMPSFDFGNPTSLFNAILKIKSMKFDAIQLRKLSLDLVDPQKTANKMKNLYQAKLAEARDTRSANEL